MRDLLVATWKKGSKRRSSAQYLCATEHHWRCLASAAASRTSVHVCPRQGNCRQLPATAPKRPKATKTAAAHPHTAAPPASTAARPGPPAGRPPRPGPPLQRLSGGGKGSLSQLQARAGSRPGGSMGWAAWRSVPAATFARRSSFPLKQAASHERFMPSSLPGDHPALPRQLATPSPAYSMPGSRAAGTMAASTRAHTVRNGTPASETSRNQKWCHTNQPPAGHGEGSDAARGVQRTYGTCGGPVHARKSAVRAAA